MSCNRFTGGAKLTVVLAVIACTLLSAPLDAQAAAKKHQLNFKLFGRTAHLEITVGTLGLVVILTLAILLAVAVLFAMVARRRARETETANRKLAIEITERKSAQETQERLVSILEATSDLVGMTDPSGNIIYLNRAGLSMFGVEHLDAVGQRRHPEWAARLIAETGIPTAIAEGAWSGESALLDANGRETPVSQVILAHRDRDGRLEYLSTIARDITGRKQAEETAQRLAAIVDGSDDAIVGKTLDGIITTWNGGAERLFGYSAEEMIGNTIARLIPPDRTQETTEILDQIRSGGTLKHYETERLTKDGLRIVVSLTVSPIRDGAGRIVGAAKIARDITQQRQLEERLQQSQKMEAIGRLAGGIAHDFNNLLTVINGYAKLALRKLDSGDPLQRYFLQIEGAGRRASGLTQQLLAFSRKQVLQPSVLNINKVIQAMEPLLIRLIREDIRLDAVLDPALLSIEADTHQIEQVLMNLVINASDAMPSGGTLTIETKDVYLDKEYALQRVDVTPGAYVMLAVSDTGTGMDAATQARVFEPFFTTKPTGKGTGLGLSTVYGVVKQSGGHVAVYSEIGIGTTFRVYLPATTQPVTEEPVKPEVTSLQGTETILLVEDHAGLRQYAVEVLRDLGYQVHEAANSSEALAIGKAQRDKVDLLITDVVMPDMGGRELAEALAPLARRMRVLYMSGYTENFIVKQGVLDPGIEFLAKPFNPEDLAEKVKGILAKSQRVPSIMVVDDDSEVLALLSEILTRDGFDVSVASNGSEAISMCHRKAVNLLITDLVMPEREGIETIRCFRKEMPHTKIIAISGAFDGEFLRAAEMFGASRVLQKPIEPEKLLQAVHTIIG
jgi:PAS domain S-box-containing protein